MATREERHSTRGRARLLFEMLRGDVIGQKTWRDESVKEALDLCLACKGCKGECPVLVDMATYKAEFMAHYYRHRLRPVAAYGIGHIYWWARLAAHAPALVNLITQTRPFADLFKRLGGIAPQRRVPAFAAETFKRGYFRTQPARGDAEDRPRVILWADTFNNHFTPGIAHSAVRVLEAAGFQVVVPRESLCCGRPLYDYGFLDQAKGLLRQVMRVLESEIRAGTPLVGLEPSCVAVFRDELPNLFPGNELAARLSAQSFLLSEILISRAPDFDFPALPRQAIVHGHCHQKSIMGMKNDTRVLDRLGTDYHMLDSGCCGMAGGFGFESGEHYDVSITAGERVLLPAVRKAPLESLIIADGFSCREQIAQTTDRRALHLAQVLEMSLEHDQERRPLPETRYAERPAALSATHRIALATALLLSVEGAFSAIVRRIRKS
jgi:Fe-S oxidoreductase